MAAALTRYRIMAWIVGVLLVVLALIGMPMKYLGHNESVVAIVGPVHGWMFLLYLITAVMICRQARFSVTKTLLVMLAGTVPFFSFWAEHVVTRDVRAQLAAVPASPPTTGDGPDAGTGPGSGVGTGTASA